MSPHAALDFQIGRYRKMSGEERLAIALDLHEFSCDIAREGIRAKHPDADENEIERLLQRRLTLTRAA
jgi:Rv0078B-related antitoxin